MILSHKYRFLFVKTMKTAGTSIEVYLSQFCGPDDILTPIYPPVPPHQAKNHDGTFHNHMAARRIRRHLDEAVWNGYFKFCVERNPWDKTLSHYHMLRHRSGDRLTLDAYFAKGRFCHNLPKYTGQRGRLIVDRVLKYENLTAELSEVFAQLGIPFHGSLGVRAKSHYRKDHRPYQEVFSQEQAQRVQDVFAQEIALHGYRF